MAARKTSPIRVPSAKAGDQPATRRMLSLVRDELKSEIRTQVQKLDKKLDLHTKITQDEFVKIRGEMRTDSAKLRDEMKSEFAKVRGEMSVESGKVQYEFGNIRAEMRAESIKVQGQFDKVQDQFDKVHTEISEMKTSLIRMEFLLEEQNANNRVVLEGLQLLWQRQRRLESPRSK